MCGMMEFDLRFVGVYQVYKKLEPLFLFPPLINIYDCRGAKLGLLHQQAHIPNVCQKRRVRRPGVGPGSHHWE